MHLTDGSTSDNHRGACDSQFPKRAACFFLSLNRFPLTMSIKQLSPPQSVSILLSNFNANGELVIFSDRRRQGDEEKGRFYGIHADVKLAKFAA